jgi:hypothetical protein
MKSLPVKRRSLEISSVTTATAVSSTSEYISHDHPTNDEDST